MSASAYDWRCAHGKGRDDRCAECVDNARRLLAADTFERKYRPKRYARTHAPKPDSSFVFVTFKGGRR